MEFKFLVAKNDIKGLPGLEKGAAVVRTAMAVLEGGYEYDVWHVLDNGLTAMTRIEHREEFDELVVEGDTPDEVIEKVKEAISRL